MLLDSFPFACLIQEIQCEYLQMIRGMITSTVVAIIITSGGNLQCTHGLLATVLLKLLTQTTQDRIGVEIRCS